MRYENLNELIRHSASTRRYFFSLSPDTQIKLGEMGEHIRSAAELRLTADAIERYGHAVEISEMM